MQDTTVQKIEFGKEYNLSTNELYKILQSEIFAQSFISVFYEIVKNENSLEIKHKDTKNRLVIKGNTNINCELDYSEITLKFVQNGIKIYVIINLSFISLSFNHNDALIIFH
ncbi:MAG: hypothetical protein ACPG45_10755 [Flavobacteriaceae bacterium]